MGPHGQAQLQDRTGSSGRYASRDLTPTQSQVLRAVWTDFNGTNAYPGLDRQAHGLRMHPNTVWKARKALVAAGELVETGRNGRNGLKIYSVAAMATAARGLTRQGCEPMGSHEKPVAHTETPVGSHPRMWTTCCGIGCSRCRRSGAP